MNGVDLQQFQFDYDLSWAAFFLHPDGTVYARYGSRSAKGPMAHNSVKGLVWTMRAVLAAHRQYPANRDLFALKRGPEPRFRRPEDIPSRRTRFRGGIITRQNCTHCHNVQEALHDVEMKEGSGRPGEIFKYPFPENVGLVMDPEAGNRLRRVLPGSPAMKAGLEAGDVLVALNGQAILSLADTQHVLHHLPDKSEVEVRVEREGSLLKKRLHLSGDWRRTDFSWRVSLKGYPPDPGLYVHMLGSAAKEKHGIEAKRVALEVRGLFEPAVRRSGLKDGDIIVKYDGKTEALSAPSFKKYIRLHHFLPGSVLRLDVLRKGQVRRVDVKF